MGKSEWRTRPRIRTYFGLSVEGGQVVGVSSVRTDPHCSNSVVLMLVASATIRVYPTVAIGASLLTVVPNTSQNVTALGVGFISLVAKYQNAWTNAGITTSFMLATDEYLFVGLPIRPLTHYSSYFPSISTGPPRPPICPTSTPSSTSLRVFRQTIQ